MDTPIKQKNNPPIITTEEEPLEVSSVSESQNSQSVKTAIQIQREVNVPVPPPEMMEYYEHIFPGSAKDFFDMAKEEAKHRRAMDSKMIDSQIADSRRGIWLGFASAIAGFSLAGWALYLEHPAVACVLSTTTVIALATTFITGNRK